jgi:hypothetical protein
MPENLLQKENIEQQPFEKQAETSLTEMNEEMGKFLGELDALEKGAENVAGDEGEKLREQIKELKNEAKWTADWWAGNILAFTNLVVGDGINFPAIEKMKEETKQETFEEMKERAKKELAENGVTSEQMKTYQPLNKILQQGIEPFSYNLTEKIINLFPNIFHLRSKADFLKKRDDAWKMYLGIQQENNTFEISDFNPDNPQSDEYCYKLKDFWKIFSDVEMPIPTLIQKLVAKGGTATPIDTTCGVMGNYSIKLGQDEKGSFIAYSDVWDIKSFPENEKGFFGKPFHIYDRLYYDPETYEPIFE